MHFVVGNSEFDKSFLCSPHLKVWWKTPGFNAHW